MVFLTAHFTESQRLSISLASSVLSIFCILPSLVLLVEGAYVQFAIQTKVNFIEELHTTVLSAVVIGVGFLCVLQNSISGAFVFLSRRKKKRKKLVRCLFPTVISGIILSIGALVVGIMCFLETLVMERSFSAGIKTAMEVYHQNTIIKQEMDILQVDFECCGKFSYMDWFQTQWAQHGREPGAAPGIDVDNVPYSCCDPSSSRPCIHDYVHTDTRHYKYNHKTNVTIFQTGCSTALVEFYGKKLLTELALLIISICVLQFIVVVLTRFTQTSMSMAILKRDMFGDATGYLFGLTGGMDNDADAVDLLNADDDFDTNANSCDFNNSTANLSDDDDFSDDSNCHWHYNGSSTDNSMDAYYSQSIEYNNESAAAENNAYSSQTRMYHTGQPVADINTYYTGQPFAETGTLYNGRQDAQTSMHYTGRPVAEKGMLYTGQPVAETSMHYTGRPVAETSMHYTGRPVAETNMHYTGRPVAETGMPYTGRLVAETSMHYTGRPVAETGMPYTGQTVAETSMLHTGQPRAVNSRYYTASNQPIVRNSGYHINQPATTYGMYVTPSVTMAQSYVTPSVTMAQSYVTPPVSPMAQSYVMPSTTMAQSYPKPSTARSYVTPSMPMGQYDSANDQLYNNRPIAMQPSSMNAYDAFNYWASNTSDINQAIEQTFNTYGRHHSPMTNRETLYGHSR